MIERPAAFTFYERGWIVRIQPPSDPNSRKVMLMLHGWTGDENVMSVFGQKLPKVYWLISPRGPVKADPSGFGWLPVNLPKFAKYSDYAAATEDLDRQVEHWLDYLHIPTRSISLMGFSQGGAMALNYLLRYPDRVDRVACLAGFLPDLAGEALNTQALSGKPIFIGHGSLDETITIEHARSAVTALRSAGAEVIFCQDEVGHKLGPDCYKGLTTFFSFSE